MQQPVTKSADAVQILHFFDPLRHTVNIFSHRLGFHGLTPSLVLMVRE